MFLQTWPCWLTPPSASSAWLDLNLYLLLFVTSLTLFVFPFHNSLHNYPSSPALPTLISQTAGPDLFLGCLCCCLAISRHVLLPASQGTIFCRQKMSLVHKLKVSDNDRVQTGFKKLSNRKKNMVGILASGFFEKSKVRFWHGRFCCAPWWHWNHQDNSLRNRCHRAFPCARKLLID